MPTPVLSRSSSQRRNRRSSRCGSTATGSSTPGSSPDGKVYRKRPDGEVEVVFDPEAKYIWALLGDGDGGLLVGTGPEGKLHRVDLGSGESTLLYDSTDLHIRSLARRADGTLFAGTAGEGLLLEIDAAGSARTLYDAAGAGGAGDRSG